MEFRRFCTVAKAFWLCFLISTLNTISVSFVEGSHKIPKKYQGLKLKGTVKTIVDPENDVVIDCVGFYQQPSFDDPLFKKFQADDPSCIPSETKITNDDLEKSGLYQNWRKYGECPTKTIPIRRIHNRKGLDKKSWMQKSNGQFDNHEYAIVQHKYGRYYGGKAKLNVWQPKTESREISIAQMWLGSGNHLKNEQNTIEVGWIVYPTKYNDYNPVAFIFWTADSYHKTGCYNFECSGFIQTLSAYALDVPLTSSTYNNSKELYEISVEVKHVKNGESRNWVLKLNEQEIGYWPGYIFDTLQNGADTVHWGGEILNRRPDGYHTTTQMGSGHFANEGFSKAGLVRKLGIVYTSEGYWADVDENNLAIYTSRSECYNVVIPPPTNKLGTHFFYGGPGFTTGCEY